MAFEKIGYDGVLMYEVKDAQRRPQRCSSGPSPRAAARSAD